MKRLWLHHALPFHTPLKEVLSGILPARPRQPCVPAVSCPRRGLANADSLSHSCPMRMATPQHTITPPKPAPCIIVHNGALGDFACAWPALHAIAQHHRIKRAGAPLYFYGHSERGQWLEKLGYLRCTPHVRRIIERLYAGIPTPEFARHNILWFCLHSPPSDAAPHVTPLPALSAGPDMHVTQALLHALHALGIQTDWDWRGSWRDAVGSWHGPDSRLVVLFPGAGHVMKRWPMQRFEHVACALAAEGWEPLWVMGPAERDGGMSPPVGHRVHMPQSYRELVDLLCRVRLVIGNDCGPMHLAAMSQVPTLTIFGPADHRRWAPDRKRLLRADMPCSPCTLTTRDIHCTHTTPDGIPACLDALDTGSVLQMARMQLEATAEA